ncbi:MAG TPA: hypothetical protein DCS93_23455 [Microscillaceae bacterium]|nr:hypothetical protein [Microscillaceae bacterium]
MKVFYIQLLIALFVIGYLPELSAQSHPEGTYYSMMGNVTNVVFTPKKGNYLQAEFFFFDGDREKALLKPLDKKTKILEGKFDDNTFVRLMPDKPLVKFYFLSEYRRVYNVGLLASSKKTMRRARKQFKALKTDPLLGKYLLLHPTSAFHQKNTHKIVFFSEKPVVGKEDLTKVKTSFKAGESIWAVAYFSRPLSDGWYQWYLTRRKELRFGIGILEDNKKSDFVTSIDLIRTLPLTTIDLQKNYAVFALVPKKGHQGMYLSSALLVTELMAQLEPTDHLMGIGLVEKHSYSRKIFGTFTLDASQGMKKVKALHKTLKKKNLARYQLPKAQMNNPALNKQVLQAIQRFGQAGGWKETFHKVVITSPDWQTITHESTGNIMGRMIEAACAAKWPDGHCTYQYFYFVQDHQGGGKYSQTVRRHATGRQYTIDCQKIK